MRRFESFPVYCTTAKRKQPQEVLMRLRLKLLLAVLATMMVLPASAIARQRPHVPSWFVRDATCVHMHEEHWSWRWASWYHPHYAYWNGYYTGMQFAGSTWER